MSLRARVGRNELIVLAVVLLPAILIVAMEVKDARQAVTLLFLVPVVLLALAFGVYGGLAGALVSIAMLAIWVAHQNVDLNTVGWTSRIVAYFAIGALVGYYENFARRLMRRQLDESYAMEIHDGVVQSLVVASYELRRGDAAEAGEAVDEALASAKRIISARMPAIKPGDLRLTPRDGDGRPRGG